MFKTIIASFILALTNIRSHFFHTVLSVLGIVIGVAALVAILSLIDGMEQYANDQISSTTSLRMIHVNPDGYKRNGGIMIRKDTVTILDYHDFNELQSSLTRPAKAFMFQRTAREIMLEKDTSRIAGHTTGVIGLDTTDTIIAGRAFAKDEITNRSSVCILTESLAKKMAGQNEIKNIIGRNVKFTDRSMKVVGVISLKHAQGPELFFPFTLFSTDDLKRNLPQCIIEAGSVEDVPLLKEQITSYLNKRFSGKHDFKIVTNELRVEQAAKGFMLFRIIMGLIVGISVLVGGIGVMNVLLISVTERTVEIGIRKAVGANKRDIILQFLSESITISFFGSVIGVICGVLGTMIIVPIIKSLTKMPFQAAYTLNTLIVISVLSVVIGVVFGTYPAMRAAKLDPVEAIRRE